MAFINSDAFRINTHLLRKLTPLISLALFLVAIAAVHHQISVYHWAEIRQTLIDFPLSKLSACIGITLISYLVLSYYDYLALEYAGQRLPYRQVLLTACLSYAISNNVGHALVSGGSMRYRLYSSWNIPAIAIAKVIIFCAITYNIGALSLLIGSYFFTPDHALIIAALPNGVLTLSIGLACAILLLWWGLIFFYRGSINIKTFSFSLPDASLATRQLLAAVIDLLLASLVLYLPLAHYVDMPFSHFLLVYMLAQLTGLLSQVPGGIGIFEGSFLFLTAQYPAANVLAALITYRAVYYFLPLLFGGIVLAIYELRLHKLLKHQKVTASAQAITSVIPQIYSMMLLLASGMLLISSATPAIRDRLVWLNDVIPLSILELSHLLGTLAGVALLFLSQAVRRRIDAAYFATLLVLTIGIVASLVKGFDYEEASILSIMLLCFLPSKRYFYRHSALLPLQFSPQWLMLAAIILVGSVWLGFFSFKQVQYSHDLWLQFSLHADASRFLRSLMVSLTFILGFISYQFFTRSKLTLVLPSVTELERVSSIVKKSSDTHAYLATTGDKYLLWSASGNSFLMFGVTPKYWIVMSDPIGLVEEYEELVWALRTQADRHNANVAFYQVSTQYFPLYVDLGLRLIKLGEEAKVPLSDFSLEGKKRAPLRHAYNKMLREQLSFEIIPVDQVSELLPPLKNISDQWLAAKKTREKRFSLGFFNDDYLRHCAIAVVKKNEQIIAFSNLWQLDNKSEFSIDLMRYLPDSPNGTMEYLTISLLLWGKQQGYDFFNLGMAPLSGLEPHPLAPFWNKVGNTIFRFGHEFYNFEGLYQYKNKFDPQWQPRYLAAPSGFSTASALLAVTTLISGNIKGLLGK